MVETLDGLQAQGRGQRWVTLGKASEILGVDESTLRRWADDELRSLNAQIEFLLRRELRDAKRLPGHPAKPDE